MSGAKQGRDARSPCNAPSPTGPPPKGAVTTLNLGRHHKALRDLDAVLTLDPGHAGVLRSRGTALSCLGRHGEALTNLDRSLALEPDNPETLTARAIAHVSLERYEDAVGDYSAVIARVPGNLQLRFDRGIAPDAPRRG